MAEAASILKFIVDAFPSLTSRAWLGVVSVGASLVSAIVISELERLPTVALFKLVRLIKSLSSNSSTASANALIAIVDELSPAGIV